MCGAHVLIYYYSARNEAKSGGEGDWNYSDRPSFMICILVDLLVDSKDGEL